MAELMHPKKPGLLPGFFAFDLMLRGQKGLDVVE